LVPACTDCQFEKRDKYPSIAGEQTLHPYFDDPQEDRWLVAEVLQQQPPVLAFSIQPPAHWSSVDTDRHERHLQVFDLKDRFSQKAGERLVVIRGSLTRLRRDGGTQAVKDHLLDQAKSSREAWPNSWETATYEACSASTWFCDVGFSYAK
jgi:hypothetical protein